MAVHPAGPKLFDSIPFRHLAQVKSGGDASVNVSLNVTPFVDMMTILVCFLLMVFSTNGELIAVQSGMRLPDATQKESLKRAPILIVTADDITFNGEHMAFPKDILEDSGLDLKIPALFERLNSENRRFDMSKLSTKEKQYCANAGQGNPKGNEICLKGLLILQADRDTPAKVLNKVIKTANLAEYPNIMFAVNRKSRSE